MRARTSAVLSVEELPPITSVTGLALAGELDFATCSQLRELLFEAMAVPQPMVLLDLTGLVFVDSSGIGLLIAAVKQARARRGDVAIAGAQGSVAKLFEITGLCRVFELFPTLAAAEAGLAAIDGLVCEVPG